MNSIEREIINRQHDKKRREESAETFGNVMGFLVILATFVGVMSVLINN